MVNKSNVYADLRKFMDKRLDIRLNGNRRIVGVLRGHDKCMNLVLHSTVEVLADGQQNDLGVVVVRGNSVLMWEALDKAKV
ncbi:MAG: hypothetical protein KVP17_000837 [Porospora cf. gigantea B]|uniref:uncharacterized protein n=1 Tax=Porospora cf. gigantea A TaxID=2853593 RepID=UPI00355A8253|nr:MAG: hypothetical protein KVP18_004973 [Porospora cf. gigantea A]KAH0488680.1 MAG: hypothetical protein KVP17_000837 [Porospora cf. gigantea B]